MQEDNPLYISILILFSQKAIRVKLAENRNLEESMQNNLLYITNLILSSQKAIHEKLAENGNLEESMRNNPLYKSPVTKVDLLNMGTQPSANWKRAKNPE